VTRELRDFVAFGFSSTHDALGAETLLGDLGVDVVPIPAPTSIRSGCGIALRVDPDDEERVADYLERAGIAVAAVVDILDY
jgi:hypothetical protein